MTSQPKIGRKESPRLATPVNTRSANAVARQKAGPTPDWQRRLIGFISKGQRGLFSLHKQIMVKIITKFVLRVGAWKCRCRISPRTSLQSNDFEAGFRHLIAEDRTSPSQADDDDVFCGELFRHCVSPAYSNPLGP